jgi:hypothetical protein
LDNLSPVAKELKKINYLSELLYLFSNNMFDAIEFAYLNGFIDEEIKIRQFSKWQLIKEFLKEINNHEK